MGAIGSQGSPNAARGFDQGAVFLGPDDELRFAALPARFSVDPGHQALDRLAVERR